jgi:hypothetical protein
MSTRTSIGGEAGRAALPLPLALGLLGGYASTAQAVRDCPTKAWWWPRDSTGGPMNDPTTWAVSLGVGPAALGVCTDGPAIGQWCPKLESAEDERCPAQQENMP